MSEEIVLDNEECYQCGNPIHGECMKYDDNFFCCEKCLGSYLIEKNEDYIEWLDVITQAEMDAREYEDHYDQMTDGGFW